LCLEALTHRHLQSSYSVNLKEFTMSVSKRLGALLLMIAASLIVAACGSPSDESATTVDDGESDLGFGSPAEPADADRVVDVAATDELVFEPAQFDVAVGETITFRIVNQGNLVHDFTLGDQRAQDEHETEMAEMGDMVHEAPNVVSIPAGETVELTWAFTEAGTVLIGCHEPGHYAAGMKGGITVEG
jgi:uncharacterized cupredoxin-like copper-binding protein